MPAIQMDLRGAARARRGAPTARAGTTAARRRHTRRWRIQILPPRRVAPGVWWIRGGLPLYSFNCYLIDDGRGGYTAFDSGTRKMGRAIAQLTQGRIHTVVLGHGHPDHRGGAPAIGAPVFCHPAERAIVEGDGGRSEVNTGGRKERLLTMPDMPLPGARIWAQDMMDRWDAGPVEVAGTVGEGDEVAGFRVVHVPGHTRGSIVLFRDSDRVALTSDCFYTFRNGVPPKTPPRPPSKAYTLDIDQAKQSIAKLAALDPSAAYPGHFDPVVSDVPGQLRRAAELP